VVKANCMGGPTPTAFTAATLIRYTVLGRRPDSQISSPATTHALFTYLVTI